jgi:toxin ParE1/3/4
VKFRYEPAARRELDAAMDFYDQQRTGLGDEFLDEVERAIALLTENTKLGRGLPENHRFFLLFQFPFRLVYALEDSGIRIIAVAHQKRRPDYWRGRVEEPEPKYAILRQAA